MKRHFAKTFIAGLKRLGFDIEWETHTTDEEGCWRMWSNGFTSFEDAQESMRQDIAREKRWNTHMLDTRVKWRIACRMVWTSYCEA